MNKIVMKRAPLYLLALAVSGTSSSMALAAEGFALEEVVVTAQKRAESLQDVPISMLAMSGENIKEAGMARMEDFTASIPAVTVAKNTIGTFLFVRGVGTPGTNQGMEQSVSIFHDGTYMGRHQLARAPFMDLDRVEVLRGPQSILFGKNTIGGALSLHTALPTEEFEGEVSALYEPDDGEKEVNLVLSGPLSDKVRGRLALRSYELDGYLENTMTSDDNPSKDDFTARGTLVWDATDDLTVTAKYETSSFDYEGAAAQLGVINPLTPGATAFSNLNLALAGGGPLAWDDEREVINDGGAKAIAMGLLPAADGYPSLNDGGETDMSVASVTFEWSLGEYTLTAQTSYAEYDYVDVCDCDFSALPFIQVNAAEDYEQWSQEIRLTSPVGKTFEYIAGLYYHQSDMLFTSDEGFGTAALGAPNVSRTYRLDQDQDMWALFGSLTWNFAEDTRATFGLRYSEEEKEATHFLNKRFTAGMDFGGGFAYGNTAAEYDRFASELPAASAGLDAALWSLLGTSEHNLDRSRNEEHVSWSLNLEHDLTEEVMVYASVATGFKGGGFDGRFLGDNLGATFEFEQEEAINYELGAKMTLLNGAATLNATVFRTDVDDFQVSVFDGATGFLVTNAAELWVEGVEVDARWRATEYLTVNAAMTYLDNRWETWDTAPCTAAQTVAGVLDCSQGQDLGGEPNILSPEWAYNLALDYARPVFNTLEFRSVLTFNYSDEYYTAPDLDAASLQDAFTKVDLRLSLGNLDGTWELAVVGKNLTDEKVSNNTVDQPLVPGNHFTLMDRLRSVSVQGTYRF